MLNCSNLQIEVRRLIITRMKFQVEYNWHYGLWCYIFFGILGGWGFYWQRNTLRTIIIHHSINMCVSVWACMHKCLPLITRVSSSPHETVHCVSIWGRKRAVSEDARAPHQKLSMLLAWAGWMAINGAQTIDFSVIKWELKKRSHSLFTRLIITVAVA